MNSRGILNALVRCALTCAWLAGIAGWAASPAVGASNYGNAWVVADFDGDHKLDIVKLDPSSTGEPRLQFGPLDSTGVWASPAFRTHRLRSRDLDGDDNQDLVLETESSIAIAVWINDGRGHFERAPLEDFRVQLSQEEPQQIQASVPLFTPVLTDGRPRADAISSPAVIGPQPDSVCGGRVLAENAPQQFRSIKRGRAPPSLS